MNTADTENTPNKSVVTEEQPAVSENPEAQNTESSVVAAKGKFLQKSIWNIMKRK